MTRLAQRTVAHVPMPFSTAGSTLIGVAEQLSRCQRELGGRSLAVLSDNRGLRLSAAENVYVDHTEHCPRQYFGAWHARVDAACGLVGLPRPFYGRLHEPSIAAVRSTGADLVLLYEGHYAATSLPWWNRLRPDVTIVLYVHNPMSRSYGGRELRRMSEQCDAMVFCADHLRRATQARVGSAKAPLVTIHNGIDPCFLTAAPPAKTQDSAGDTDRFEILFMGRAVAHKGPQYLLEALDLAQASSDRPLTATVVGSTNYGLTGELSPFEQQLRSAAARSGVPVDFIPHVDRDTAVQLMRRAAAICIPSVWAEGLPLVALEALAVGTPVVAFRAAGIEEACGEAALYADVGDVGQLAAAIAATVNDEGARNARIAAGLAIAKGFSWERAWHEFDELVSSL